MGGAVTVGCRGTHVRRGWEVPSQWVVGDTREEGMGGAVTMGCRGTHVRRGWEVLSQWVVGGHT